MHGLSKKGTSYKLLSKSVDIEDLSYRSSYFVVSDLNSTLSAGKNLFCINGSQFLKDGSDIFVEILDAGGFPLYYEIANSGFIQYRDTTDLIISVHVYDNVVAGVGKIIIVGTTKDNKTVRWSSNIKINPYLDNDSRVVFFKQPTAEANGFLSYILSDDISNLSQSIQIISGSSTGNSFVPTVYSDYNTFNLKTNNVDYRIINTSEEFPFTSLIKDNDIILHIKKIGILENGNYITTSVDITKSFFVTDIINDYSLKISQPFTYKVGSSLQVCPIVSSSFQVSFTYSPYITSSGLISSSALNPDGDPDPIILFRQNINGVDRFLKESFLDITYKNIKTLSGKVNRYKIYRRSLNKATEFECVADEPVFAVELLKDYSTVNRQYNNIGEFYNIYHINKYFYTSSSDISLFHSSYPTLNTMICNISSLNEDLSRYIIVKNDTSLITISSSKSSYVPFNQISYDLQTGSSFDSNFIKLHADTEYIFSCDVNIYKLDSGLPSYLYFYLTGSYNTSSVSSEIDYNIDNGLHVYTYTLPVGTINKNFNREDNFRLFSYVNDNIGTLIIKPYNISKFELRNLSIKSVDDFGFSSDIVSTRIPFPISIKNEQFEIKTEFLDFNNNVIYTGIKKILNVDKNGESLVKNISNYLLADARTVIDIITPELNSVVFSNLSVNGLLKISGSLITSGSSSTTGSFRVTGSTVITGSIITTGSFSTSGSFGVSGSTVITGSVSVTGSPLISGSIYIPDYEMLYGTSSYAVRASAAITSSYSHVATSASAAITSSYSQVATSASAAITSSYSHVATSASAAITSSYSYTASHLKYIGDVNPNNDYFTASNFGESQTTSSGYLQAFLDGVGPIYIPYYTSI
jgi:hypothetical protein